jgi:cytochrome c-type biogenesis protein CcmH/NrfG
MAAVTARHGWVLAAAWVVVLAAFLGFRARAGSDRDSIAAFACEVAPPTDLDGLEWCLAQSPRDVELLLDLGAEYDRAGRPDAAEAAYRKASDTDPFDAEPHMRLASVRLQRGDRAGAREPAARAVALRPNDARAQALVDEAHGRPGQ